MNERQPKKEEVILARVSRGLVTTLASGNLGLLLENIEKCLRYDVKL